MSESVQHKVHVEQFREHTKFLIREAFSTDKGMDTLAEKMIEVTAINEQLENKIIALQQEITELKAKLTLKSI